MIKILLSTLFIAANLAKIDRCHTTQTVFNPQVDYTYTEGDGKPCSQKPQVFDGYLADEPRITRPFSTQDILAAWENFQTYAEFSITGTYPPPQYKT